MHRGVDSAPERLHELVGIAPDLGVEAAAAGVEVTHHGPVAHAEAQPLADAGAHEALADGASGDDLGGARAGTCGPPRSSPAAAGSSPAAPMPRITTLDGLSDPRLMQRDQHDRFLRHQPLAIGADGDLRLALDHRRPARGRPRFAPRSRRERRITTTLSQEPVSTSVLRRPSSSISTVAKTYTTSAMPPAVSAVVTLRAPRLRTTYMTAGSSMAMSADQPHRTRKPRRCDTRDARNARHHGRHQPNDQRRAAAAAPWSCGETWNTGNRLPSIAAEHGR